MVHHWKLQSYIPAVYIYITPGGKGRKNQKEKEICLRS
jgi:hypothetical protein